MPPMEHFLNSMTFLVSVPVLSENMYRTCAGKDKKTLETFTTFSSRRISEFVKMYNGKNSPVLWVQNLKPYLHTCPNSSLRLDVRAMAGVSVAS